MSKSIGEIIQGLLQDMGYQAQDHRNVAARAAGSLDVPVVGCLVRVEGKDRTPYIAYLREDMEPGMWLADVYRMDELRRRFLVAKVIAAEVMEVLTHAPMPFGYTPAQHLKREGFLQ